jgi:hypothetical protein
MPLYEHRYWDCGVTFGALCVIAKPLLARTGGCLATRSDAKVWNTDDLWAVRRRAVRDRHGCQRQG